MPPPLSRPTLYPPQWSRGKNGDRSTWYGWMCAEYSYVRETCVSLTLYSWNLLQQTFDRGSHAGWIQKNSAMWLITRNGSHAISLSFDKFPAVIGPIVRNTIYFFTLRAYLLFTWCCFYNYSAFGCNCVHCSIKFYSILSTLYFTVGLSPVS